MKEKKFLSLLGLMGIFFVLVLFWPESFWHTSGYQAEEAVLTVPPPKLEVKPNEAGEVIVICTPMADEFEDDRDEQDAQSSESSQSVNSDVPNPMVTDSTNEGSESQFQSVSWTSENNADSSEDEFPTVPGVNGRTLFKPRTHQIVDGDSLESIARRYLYDPARAMDIYELNRNRLESPALLPIGTVLTIPDPEW